MWTRNHDDVSYYVEGRRKPRLRPIVKVALFLAAGALLVKWSAEGRDKNAGAVGGEAAQQLKRAEKIRAEMRREDIERHQRSRENVALTNVGWEKGGFGSVMLASFRITNKNEFPVKDFKIVCSYSSRRRGHGRSHRRAWGCLSACRRASVIRPRVDLHPPVACDPALGRHAREPGVDQLDQSVGLEAVCEQDRRGAAVGGRGEQFDRATALGAAARVLCHFRHALDVSSAYEIGESSQGPLTGNTGENFESHIRRRLGTRSRRHK
jgi:hypothetical protein